MEKYTRVEKPRPEEPISENEMRITSQGKIRSYITYASVLLQEKKHPSIVVKAMGRAISKAVLVSEIIKRRIAGLHQITAITSTDITDLWEPVEEGLLPLETTRHVSMISITLSTVELDRSDPGYQEPIPLDQMQPFEEGAEGAYGGDGGMRTGGRRGRGRGRGGRGRGRGGRGPGGEVPVGGEQPAGGASGAPDGTEGGVPTAGEGVVSEGAPGADAAGAGRGRGRGRGRGGGEGRGRGRGRSRGRWGDRGTGAPEGGAGEGGAVAAQQALGSDAAPGAGAAPAPAYPVQPPAVQPVLQGPPAQ